ncbi:isochorismatase family protein [Thermodesulfobacteriota bacterium]
MNGLEEKALKLGSGDALLIVDVQVDFLPSGNLAVPRGDEVVPALNRYLETTGSLGLPVFATRDLHPPNHCSFEKQGGIWPPHCVADSAGAEFADNLHLPSSTTIISKATAIEKDAYSGFEGTDLDQQLRDAGIKRLLIGGLATDYCVLNTVKDALKLGYDVLLLKDAIRAVDVQPEDGKNAEEEMVQLGATPVTLKSFR